MIDGLLKSAYIERVTAWFTQDAAAWDRLRINRIPRRDLISAWLVARFVKR